MPFVSARVDERVPLPPPGASAAGPLARGAANNDAHQRDLSARKSLSGSIPTMFNVIFAGRNPDLH